MIDIYVWKQDDAEYNSIVTLHFIVNYACAGFIKKSHLLSYFVIMQCLPVLYATIQVCKYILWHPHAYESV